MANPFFGNFGDVWKHLALAELLARTRPGAYWETHAGSARYPLTHAAQRDYGVYHFLAHAHEQPTLLGSRYWAHLCQVRQTDGAPGDYPGSAYLAMLELGASVDEYLLCDLDADSGVDLAATARTLGLDTHTRIPVADGTTTVWRLVRTGAGRAADRVVVLVDPFEPRERSGAGPDAIGALELTAELALRGYRVIFWYAVEDGKEPGWPWREVGPRLATAWGGELVLRSVLASGVTGHPGLLGCGVLCANFTAADYATLQELGTALAAIYASTTLETGDSGALAFSARS